MLRDKLNTYRPSIDPEDSEDGTMLGINLISNVKNPAVKIKGVAFSNHNTKELKFQDAKKLRIAAPVLVPEEIYRDDEDEQYFMKFTVEDVEMLAKDFMSRMTSRENDVFNFEHDKGIMVDSYLLEAILVDSESKVGMIKDTYGVKVPLGSFFIVQQFNSEEEYNKIVESGATSFSFEGFLGTKLVNEYKFKENKMTKNLKLSAMKDARKLVGVKRVFMSASKKMKLENEAVKDNELIVVAESFEEGKDVVVIEDVTQGGVEDFTGEVDANVDGVDSTLIIENGVITEVVTVDEAPATDEAPEVKDEEMAADAPKVEDEPEVKDAEMADEAPAVVDAPVAPVTIDTTVTDEIYKMIADLKAEIAELKGASTTTENVPVSQEVKEQMFTEAVLRFAKKSQK